MKKFVKVLATSAMALSFAAVSAMAGNGMPDGKFFQFRLIGHPGNTDVLKENADKSQGKAIMVPLTNKEVSGKKQTDGTMLCEYDGTILQASDGTDTVDYVTHINDIDGAKIYFTKSDDDKFHIIDRDATDDGGAEIEVPVTDGVLNYDVYVRVLGKPNKCMNLSGWAQEATGNNYWYLADQISLSRKATRPTRIDANSLFSVDYCPITDGECTEKIETYSVFDQIFGQYIWNVQNDGVRNVEVRLYPKAP